MNANESNLYYSVLIVLSLVYRVYAMAISLCAMFPSGSKDLLWLASMECSEESEFSLFCFISQCLTTWLLWLRPLPPSLFKV